MTQFRASVKDGKTSQTEGQLASPDRPSCQISHLTRSVSYLVPPIADYGDQMKNEQHYTHLRFRMESQNRDSLSRR